MTDDWVDSRIGRCAAAIGRLQGLLVADDSSSFDNSVDLADA